MFEDHNLVLHHTDSDTMGLKTLALPSILGVYHDMTEHVDANKKSSTSCLKSPKTPEMCVFPLNLGRIE